MGTLRAAGYREGMETQRVQGEVLSGIRIHPVKGEPGTALEEAIVGPDGIEGDRRKKAAVHVVSAAEAEGVRANLVVGLSADALAESVGRLLRVGDVLLEVGRTSGSCPGVYAEVAHPGTVHVGDPVVIGADR